MASESIQDIKRRIRSVTSTEHITSAMKLVSAGKLRKAKAIYEKTNANSHYITNTIKEMFNSSQEIPQEYLAGNREVKTTCYVGSKGKEYFEKRGYEIHSSYLSPPESISFLESRELSAPILEMYNNKEIDEVVLIYTAFISSLEQEVRNVTLLPFEIENDPDFERTYNSMEYEPSVEEVFNYLVPKYVETMIYSAVVESATCEHAARRMAMENATDNAREMLDDLNLTYNRARQSAITDEIIEIVAGSEAQN